MPSSFNVCTTSEEPLEVVEALLDRVTALDARNAGDEARRARRCELASVAGEAHAVGTALDELVERAEQVARARERAARARLGVLRVDPRHEHERAQAARRAALEVEMARPRDREVVSEVERALERVRVRVEDRTFCDQRPSGRRQRDCVLHAADDSPALVTA
jgi:hypothetical protein